MYSNLRHNTEASLSQANGSLMERGAERGEGVPDARTPRKGSRHASSLSARQIYKRSEALTWNLLDTFKEVNLLEQLN